MIIQATRITTGSGAAAVGTHVLSGPRNEAITVLQGCRADLDDMVADAREHGAKYAIRHYSISPEQAATREDALAVVADLAREFGFDPARAVVVEHQKQRADGAGFERHWHALVPEVDPARSRVLDAHWMRARHEKIARLAEIRLGHDLVAGKWNAAVVRALVAEGEHAAADRVRALAAAERPRAAFTSDARHAAERRGIDSVPAARQAVADAWRSGDTDVARLAAVRDAGFEIERGRKDGVLLVVGRAADGERVEIGALDRLTREARQEAVAGAGEWRARLAAAFDQATAPAGPPVAPSTARSDLAATMGGAELASPDETQSRPAETPSHLPMLAPGGAGGGAPAADAVDDGSGDHVAPLDPTKPHDWMRFLRQVAVLEKKRAAAAAAAAHHGGGSNAPIPFAWRPGQAEDAAWLLRPTRRPARAALGYDQDHRDPERDRYAGTAASRSEGAARPTGIVADADRSAHRSEGQRGGQREARQPVVADGRGDRAASGDRRTVGESRRGPGADRTASCRARITARKQARGLAAAVASRAGRLAQLAADLAPPEERLRRELEASQRRIASIMSCQPWPTPASRDPAALALAAHEATMAEMRRRDVEADAARERVQKAMQAVGAVSRVLAVLGITTLAQQAAEMAKGAAMQAETAQWDGRELRERIHLAEAAARAEASRRQRQHDAWHKRPEVRATEREALGNSLVVDALRQEDPVIRHLTEVGLDTARAAVLRRHQDGLRRAEEQRQAAEARAEMVRRQRIPQGSTPAPGMRR